MTTITRERLLKIQQWRETYGTGSNVMLPAEEAEELARIALTAMQQEPVERVTADQMQRVCMEATRHIGKYAAMAREVNKLLRRTTPPAPVMPAELHPDTQNLVADFCTVLAEKLYKAQLKYGYDADWKQDGWHTQCLSHFHQHIAKGDPRDVAAYCAFMWYHGWKTESVSGPVVPEEMPKGLAGQIVSLLAHNIGDKLLAQKIWNACRAVMLQSKYRDLSQPVDPQISEYEKIMQRVGWVMVPVEPTDEMIAAAMNCEDVLFNSDESFCVQFGNIYEAMLAAAPQPEISH
ncbi:TPA: hypothetical protein G9E81_001077 [Salmonella enterica]|uniref:DUF551 domain-containing protein n=1 Tax=Salmonella enterica TaxID=28901 RepID=A0A743TYR3_SALER|nr:hypothetical protein [Salmonella enterica]HAF2208485.1 hypothetical protein [Salmonella enterica]